MPDNENQAYIDKRRIKQKKKKEKKIYEEVKTHLMYPAGSGTHANIRHPAPGQR